MDINELSYLGLGWIGQTLFNDNVWKAFGFSGRPKRGKFFDFLVPKQKLNIERFLFKELFALSLVDIAQAVKPINKYNQPYCDYRALMLTGIIGYAWEMGTFDNFDDFIDSIRAVNSYTANSANNNIPQIFVTRLIKAANLDDMKKVQVMFGATNLLASANKENGLINFNATYRDKL